MKLKYGIYKLIFLACVSVNGLFSAQMHPTTSSETAFSEQKNRLKSFLREKRVIIGSVITASILSFLFFKRNWCFGWLYNSLKTGTDKKTAEDIRKRISDEDLQSLPRDRVPNEILDWIFNRRKRYMQQYGALALKMAAQDLSALRERQKELLKAEEENLTKAWEDVRTARREKLNSVKEAGDSVPDDLVQRTLQFCENESIKDADDREEFFLRMQQEFAENQRAVPSHEERIKLWEASPEFANTLRRVSSFLWFFGCNKSPKGIQHFGPLSKRLRDEFIRFHPDKAGDQHGFSQSIRLKICGVLTSYRTVHDDCFVKGANEPLDEVEAQGEIVTVKDGHHNYPPRPESKERLDQAMPANDASEEERLSHGKDQSTKTDPSQPVPKKGPDILGID